MRCVCDFVMHWPLQGAINNEYGCKAQGAGKGPSAKQASAAMLGTIEFLLDL
jgi:hypothetical protein